MRTGQFESSYTVEKDMSTSSDTSRGEIADLWPALPFEVWRETRETLHMWTQIVGKVRLALSPHMNHWWQVPLYITLVE